MQGHLRNEPVSVDVETACKHCKLEMRFTIDSDLRVSVPAAGVQPCVFLPDVDWSGFKERTIIDSY